MEMAFELTLSVLSETDFFVSYLRIVKMTSENKIRSLVPDVIVYMSFLLLVSAFNYNSKTANHAWLLLYLSLVASGVFYIRRQQRRRSVMKRADRLEFRFPFLALFVTLVVAVVWAVIDFWNTPIQGWGL